MDPDDGRARRIELSWAVNVEKRIGIGGIITQRALRGHIVGQMLHQRIGRRLSAMVEQHADRPDAGPRGDVEDGDCSQRDYRHQCEQEFLHAPTPLLLFTLTGRQCFPGVNAGIGHQ